MTNSSVYDHITSAKDALQQVHSCMLDALLESQTDSNSENWLSSSDFEELNALSRKLDSLAQRFAPPYEQPTFGDLAKEWTR